jgi:hypothetical protein
MDFASSREKKKSLPDKPADDLTLNQGGFCSMVASCRSCASRVIPGSHP